MVVIDVLQVTSGDVRICMHVCVYVCMCECVSVYVYACIHTLCYMINIVTIFHFKVTHNTCTLHLATHFQNQTSHMGMFYMVY